MNLSQMREQLQNLTNQYNAAAATGAQLAMDATPDVSAIQANNTTCANLQASITALRNAIAGNEAQGAAAASTTTAPAMDESAMARRNSIRASREYTRAFCAAMRNGYKPGRSQYQEQYKPLHDVLTIGGGDPAGSQGGFAVPQDIDTTINRLIKEKFALRNYFRVENVNTTTGSRVLENGKFARFVKIAEGQPAKKTGTGAYDAHVTGTEGDILKKVSYSLSTYRKMVELSAELLQDEDAGIVAYISEKLAEAKAATENYELLALLNTLTAATLTATDSVAKVKEVLNTKLTRAYSKRAMVLTNANGFNVLDMAEDDYGRPLLQPNPAMSTGKMIAGHVLDYADNADIADETVESVTKHPLYVGDFASFGVLFDHAGGMELATSTEGGDSWENNTVSLRAIMRQDYQIWDGSAAQKILL